MQRTSLTAEIHHDSNVLVSWRAFGQARVLAARAVRRPLPAYGQPLLTGPGPLEPGAVSVGTRRPRVSRPPDRRQEAAVQSRTAQDEPSVLWPQAGVVLDLPTGNRIGAGIRF